MRKKWTQELLQIEADKCLTRKEFWNNSHPAANAASKKKLIDELFKNHINKGYSKNKSVNGYWTKEILQIESNKYKTISEFRKNNNKAYVSAQKNGLINEIFKNHINNGYSNKWDDNIYIIYVYELIEFNKSYIGLTKNINRRDKEHLFRENGKLINFCREMNVPLPKYKILQDNLNPLDAKRQEQFWVDYYKNNNWELLNIAKPGSLGGSYIKWNKKTLQKEVNKYNTRSELNTNNPSAYNASLKKKIIDELFKNHINQGRSNKQKEFKYWTKERLQEEVNKCKTRNEFREKSHNAYYAANNLKIINELFKDLPNKGRTNKQKISGYWTKETLQEEVNKYKIRSEFKKNNGSAYNASKRLDILNELFENHKNNGYYSKKKSE